MQIDVCKQSESWYYNVIILKYASFTNCYIFAQGIINSESVSTFE